MADQSPESLYGAEYYRSHFGPIGYGRSSEWLEFFREIAARVVERLAPRRVFDAGCAWGLLVEALRDRGVDAWGADISQFAISQVRPDIRPYCRVASLTDPIEGRFDLITCIEVFEHLAPEETGLAMGRLTAATDTILFSSTPDDHEESTHANVRPLLSWLKLFTECGFVPDISFDASVVSPQAFLARRGPQAMAQEVLALFSRKLELQCEVTKRRLDLIRLSRERQAGQIGEARALRAALAEARQELEGMQSGPAWKLISGYRRWLRGHERRDSWIWKTYEPAALAALRLAKLWSPPDAASPRRTRADNWNDYREWCSRVEPDDARLALERELSGRMPYRPLISVLVPVFQVPLPVLKEMIESVLHQTYDHWELCVAHAAPEDAGARAYLLDLAARDSRVKVKVLEKNLGISGNSNAALELVSGEFIALLDHDDTLAPFALFECARALSGDPGIDFLYSDKDQIEVSGGRVAPLFKPDWSPEIMTSANYLTHLNVLRASRVREMGAWRSKTDGAQDWDLFLRFLEGPVQVHHIPMVLYHWRRVETSVALRGLEAKPYAAEAQIVSIREHLARTGSSAEVEALRDGFFRLRWPRTPMPVSIVVAQQATLAHAIEFAQRILTLDKDALELVIACTEPGQSGDARIRFVRVGASQSLAARLNAAAEACRGEALIFLDEGIGAPGEGWVRDLAGPLENPEIGAVGAKLIDRETGRIRHAGLVFSGGDLEPVFAGELEHSCEWFGAAGWNRNWLAVSGACFSIRREIFLNISKFSENPEYPRYDVDLCLRIRFQTGGRILYNPVVRFEQGPEAAIEKWLNSSTRAEAAAYIRNYFPDGDPYFNRNLVARFGKVRLKQELAPAHAWNAFSEETREVMSRYKVDEPLIAASKAVAVGRGRRKLETMVWFVPEFSNPYYGGIHTILKFADYFRERRHVRPVFAALGAGYRSGLKSAIRKAFPELAASCDVTILPPKSAGAALPPCDAAVATFWKTAFPLLVFPNAGRKFYFLQDYEAAFYPAGSTAALVESTYRFGFLGICNTAGLLERYREMGGAGEYFTPCVDGSIFHAAGRKSAPDGPYTVFFYSRPAHTRNCFELAAGTMSALKLRLGDRVRILAAGSDWDPAPYGLSGVVENLGLLDYRMTGALYRLCDAGVSLMMTSHPSYLPLELMACGALVISNRNPRTTWFLQDRVNCLMGENSPGALADAIEEGLRNRALREEITMRAAAAIAQEHSHWDAQAEKIYQYILNCF